MCIASPVGRYSINVGSAEEDARDFFVLVYLEVPFLFVLVL